MASGRLLLKLVVLIVLSLVVAFESFSWFHATDAWWKRTICVVAGVASICAATIFVSISRMIVSPYYDVTISLCHLREELSVFWTGKEQLKLLRESWKDIRSSQEQLLLRILRVNSQTFYGREFNLQAICSIDEFRERHPLTSYEHYRKYAERAMDGEPNVMTSIAPADFVRTSGTTGQSKYIPLINRLDLLKTMFGRCTASAFEQSPHIGHLQKKFLFYVAPKITKARSGGNIGPFLALSADEEHKLIPYTTPPKGFCITNLKDACYIHNLFALREPTVGVVFTFFIHYIESMMKLLEHRWSDIIHDIEHGTIHEDIQLDHEIRTSLTAALGSGNPERALELRLEFGKGFDDILKRVWPNLAIVIGIDNTNSWPAIEQKYAQGIPLLPFVYGSSEGIIGHALWTQDRRKGYSLITTELVYEFIKFEDTGESQPSTYLPDEVEVGQRYEVVITQVSGLYRYRMGDIVRVTGFEGNGVPIIEFQYRIGLMLNVRYEKLNQLTVKESLKSCVVEWSGVKLVDYAVAESNLVAEDSSAYEKDEIMPYYLIFLELHSESRDTPISIEEKQLIDAKFREVNSDYNRLRREGSISNPRVHIVKPGTFDDLKCYILENSNTSANQYKVPRKLRTYPTLQLMLNHVE